MCVRSLFFLAVMIAVSACSRGADPDSLGSPSSNADSDVVVLVAPDAEGLEPAPRRGFLGFLRKEKPESKPQSGTDILTEALIEEGAERVFATNEGPSLTDAEIEARGIVASGSPEPSTRPRLFGFLRKRALGEITADSTPTETMLAEPSGHSEPSLTDDEIALRGEVKVDPTPTGFALPMTQGFGAFAPACGLRQSELGTEVAQSPGEGTYRLFDTAPSSAEPRLQYVTGFKDGCPRQFYAALALFGEPVVHETKRYDPANKRTYSVADNAYEKVKSRVCRVGRGEFCPENRLGRLGRDVALLTAYPSFGGNAEWMDVVLFKGTVAGHAVEK